MAARVGRLVVTALLVPLYVLGLFAGLLFAVGVFARSAVMVGWADARKVGRRGAA